MQNPRPVPPRTVNVPNDLDIQTPQTNNDNNTVSTPDINRPDIGKPTRTPLK